MSTAIRIERITDRLAAFGGHLFNGACLAVLNLMIYGGRTGIAGDAFVSFARDYGTNAAVLLFALLTLAAIRGAMLVVYLVIVGIVSIPRIIRHFRGVRVTGR